MLPKVHARPSVLGSRTPTRRLVASLQSRISELETTRRGSRRLAFTPPALEPRRSTVAGTESTASGRLQSRGTPVRQPVCRSLRLVHAPLRMACLLRHRFDRDGGSGSSHDRLAALGERGDRDRGAGYPSASQKRVDAQTVPNQRERLELRSLHSGCAHLRLVGHARRELGVANTHRDDVRRRLRGARLLRIAVSVPAWRRLNKRQSCVRDDRRVAAAREETRARRGTRIQ